MGLTSGETRQKLQGLSFFPLVPYSSARSAHQSSYSAALPRPLASQQWEVKPFRHVPEYKRLGVNALTAALNTSESAASPDGVTPHIEPWFSSPLFNGLSTPPQAPFPR